MVIGSYSRGSNFIIHIKDTCSLVYSVLTGNTYLMLEVPSVCPGDIYAYLLLMLGNYGSLDSYGRYCVILLQKEKFHTHLAVLYLDHVLRLRQDSATPKLELDKAR